MKETCMNAESKEKIAIIIPTYNESENIPLLINKINKHLNKVKIFIIDDSPKAENQRLKKVVNNTVCILSRYKKLGRGSAIVLGFKEALNDDNIAYFFEMDADLTHDPSQCYKFIEKMKQTQCDVVVGSRYISGSKFIYLPKHRTFVSRIINKFLFFLLGVSLSDYTSGFRLYNRKAVLFLVKKKMLSSGFILLSEIIYRLKKNNFRISEVSINVYKRQFGESTLNMYEFLISFIFIIRLRLFEKNL